MNKFVMASLFLFAFLLSGHLDAQYLKLENQIVTANLADKKIEANDFVLIVAGRNPRATACDKLISEKLGFRLVNLTGCVLAEGQGKQIKEFNAVMEMELKKKGIDNWLNTYQKLVLECQREEQEQNKKSIDK